MFYQPRFQDTKHQLLYLATLFKGTSDCSGVLEYHIFAVVTFLNIFAVCNGDQLLDFSVPELVRSQSTFSTDPEVLQNCAYFTFVQFSGSSSRRMLCRNGFDTMHAVCTDLLCVVCIGLLSAEFSTVNLGLSRPMFWKLLCLLSIPEGLATIKYQLT